MALRKKAETDKAAMDVIVEEFIKNAGFQQRGGRKQTSSSAPTSSGAYQKQSQPTSTP
jgi:hypothetical protein